MDGSSNEIPLDRAALGSNSMQLQYDIIDDKQQI